MWNDEWHPEVVYKIWCPLGCGVICVDLPWTYMRCTVDAASWRSSLMEPREIKVDSFGQIIATSHDLTPNGVKYYNLARFMESDVPSLDISW